MATSVGTASSSETPQARIAGLALINILLQIVDGLASYHILSVRAPQDGSLLASLIARWGLVGGLVHAKAIGCLLVIALFMLRKRVELVVVQGLTLMMYVYATLALLLIGRMILLFA